MAPALTEPLSPSNKLKSSPASVDESEDDTIAIDKHFEKVIISSSTLALNTHPRTHSTDRLIKDLNQKNEQMGLNRAILNNNNRDKETFANLLSANNNNFQDTTTEQLFADLSTNFEDTISAEINLRQHIIEGNLIEENPDTIIEKKLNPITRPSALSSAILSTVSPSTSLNNIPANYEKLRSKLRLSINLQNKIENISDCHFGKVGLVVDEVDTNNLQKLHMDSEALSLTTTATTAETITTLKTSEIEIPSKQEAQIKEKEKEEEQATEQKQNISTLETNLNVLELKKNSSNFGIEKAILKLEEKHEKVGNDENKTIQLSRELFGSLSAENDEDVIFHSSNEKLNLPSSCKDNVMKIVEKVETRKNHESDSSKEENIFNNKETGELYTEHFFEEINETSKPTTTTTTSNILPVEVDTPTTTPESQCSSLENQDQNFFMTTNEEVRKSTSSKNISSSQIFSIEELPHISTDSTITASEVEDNIEDRLSQLDGIAITNVTVNMLNNSVPATPPSTPQHQSQLHIGTLETTQQQIAALQAHLQTSAQTVLPVYPEQHQQNAVHQHHQLLQQNQNFQQMSIEQQCPATIVTTAIPIPTPAITAVSQGVSFNSLSNNNNMSSTISTTLPASTSTYALEDQDIEEMLKDFKGFGGNVAPDTLCDLNLLFSEVGGNEDELLTNPQMPSTTIDIDSTEATSDTSRNNVSHKHFIPASNLTNTVDLLDQQTDSIKDLRNELGRKQQLLIRKIAFLERRLRKLQGRHMCKHATEEIGGLLEYTAKCVNKEIGKSNIPVSNVGDDNIPTSSVISSRPPEEHWEDELKIPVSKVQINIMLRKINDIANSQQIITTPSNSLLSQFQHNVNSQGRKSKKALAAAAAAEAAGNSATASSTTETIDNKTEVYIPTYDQHVCNELAHVSGLLKSEMRETLSALDSDLTLSSSGAESADEMISYNNPHQKKLEIEKRAVWRYSVERAAIASRWSWLLSQISDLELKIRQYNELYQEIARTKGPVISEEEVKVKNLKAENKKLLNPNGLNSLPGEDATSTEEAPGSARTRGYVAAIFRKRKLLQLYNIHHISKKAARPSTIKCGCTWPLSPCAICTGRVDPTAPRDLPDTMMKPDRVALLDPTFHPVLSFPKDIDPAINMDAIAATSEWQSRTLRLQVKSIAKGMIKSEKELNSSGSSKRFRGNGPLVKRRYVKKKDRLAAEALRASGLSTGSIEDGESLGDLTSIAGTTSIDGGIGAATNTSALNETGNGIGNLSSISSSSSTTAFVANRVMKSTQKSLDGEGNQMETTSVNNRLNNTSNSSHPQRQMMKDYTQINCEQQKNQQRNSSLISNNSNNINYNSSSNKHNNNNRNKLSTSSGLNSHINNNHHYNHHNNSHYYNSNKNEATTNQLSGNYLQHNSDVGNIASTSTSASSVGVGHSWDRSRTSSPTHWSTTNNYYKYERPFERKNRSSYDIDNIVIPYSVAATTRVEILPYKEIPTPKWRVIEKDKEVKGNIVNTPFTTTVTTATTNTLADVKNENVIINADIKPDVKEEIVTNGICSNLGSIEQKHSKQLDENSQSVSVKKTEPQIFDEVDTKSTSAMDIKLENENSEGKSEIVDSVKKEIEKTITRSAKKHALVLTGEKRPSNFNNADGPVMKKPKRTEKDMIVTNTVSKDPSSDCFVLLTSLDDECHLFDPFDRDGCNNISADELEEDITEDAIFMRHERALAEERKKFQTFLQFPWSTRSRANRRIDSRAESSGANTPDPTSPAPQTPLVVGGDESIPSPMAPSTVLNTLDSITETGENSSTNTSLPSFSTKRNERRRTTSKRELERRSVTPDPRELVPPYESLKFPLTDEVYEGLKLAMPADYNYDMKNLKDCPYGNVKGLRQTRNKFRNDYIRQSIKQKVANNYRQRNINNRMKRGVTDVGNIRKHTFISANSGVSNVGRLSNKAVEAIICGPITADGQPYINGKLVDENETMSENDTIGEETELSTEEDIDFDEDNDDGGEEDDDYPKNYLAPNDHDVEYTVDEYEHDDDDDDNFTVDIFNNQYNPPKLNTSALNSDYSSEEEPFQDDDPNDPEWKGTGRKKV